MKVLGFLLSLLLFLSFSFTAIAQTTEPTIKTRIDARKERLEKTQERMDKVKETRLAKLDAAKLRVCQTKEKVVGNRLQSLNRFSENMLGKFDVIATRVKDFYINKVVPRGGIVSNYDALVADVEAKKATVEQALVLAKTNSESFSCDGDDPKGALTGFREDMQLVKSALADYRTSIKDLIVAVKGAAKAVEPTPSPEAE